MNMNFGLYVPPLCAYQLSQCTAVLYVVYSCTYNVNENCEKSKCERRNAVSTQP